MQIPKGKLTAIALSSAALLMIAGCAAGDGYRFEETPACFWAGLWHGLISPVTFIIGLFTQAVRIYELNNTGNWYDFGFLLGVAVIFGGGLKAGSRSNSPAEKEWDQIAEKVERKVRRGISDWLNEEEQRTGGEWKEISRRIEEKIKRELRDWAEK